MRKPYTLIVTGLSALVMISSAALTSTSWASPAVGFLIVMTLPMLLLGAIFPLTAGASGLLRAYRSTGGGKMDLAASAITFLIVGIVIGYVIFYLTF